jgi:spermidine synthase
MDSLDIQAEDEMLLRTPRRNFESPNFEVDVLIIGGGNSFVYFAVFAHLPNANGE